MPKNSSAREPSPDAVRRFALIELDAVALLVPQHDLHAIEPVLDVDTDAPTGMAAGGIRLRSGDWPVFCPSDDLEPLAGLLPERRICAMLAHDSGLFGVVCRGVASVSARSVRLFPMPRCMVSTPLRELALHGERVVCVTDATRLHAGWA